VIVAFNSPAYRPPPLFDIGQTITQGPVSSSTLLIRPPNHLDIRKSKGNRSTMATNGTTPQDTMAMLQEILSSVRSLKQEHSELSASVDAINGRVNTLAGIKQVQDGVAHDATFAAPKSRVTDSAAPSNHADKDTNADQIEPTSPPPERRPSTTSTSKIILTSYPGQAGVDPIPLKWGKCKLSMLPGDKSAGTGYYRRRPDTSRLICPLSVVFAYKSICSHITRCQGSP